MEERKVPKHIGIIMDGNGRWAKQRGLPRSEGHKAGAKVFKQICDYAGEIGIESITFYAFSTENWKRPPEEVSSLMDLFREYMHEAEEAIEKNIAECQKQGLITKENLGFAKAAVDTFGGSEAMQVLIDTGAINHPAVCKLFVTIGQLISEDKPADTHVGGGKGTPRAEDILFPNSKY